MKKLKTNFSISEIGKFQFYSGIIIGIGYGFILNFIFKLFTKITYLNTAINKGNWNNTFNAELSFYYSLFIGLLSASFAFCITSYLWMNRPFNLNRKKRLKIRISQTNSLFIFGIMFMILVRFFTVYVMFNYENFDFDINDYFGLGIFIVPLFIFLFNWIFISKVYNSKKIFFLSLFILLLFGLILSGIKT